MEWYSGSEVDNLVVPRDQESFAAGYCFLKKKLFVGINLGCKQELIFNGIYTGVMNLNDLVQEKEHHDYNSSSMCQGGLFNGSLQWLHDEDKAQVDHLDDIFMYEMVVKSLVELSRSKLIQLTSDSLLEEDVTDADNSSDITFNNILMEQQYIPSNSKHLGSSKYLKTHDFSPPMDWENAEVSSAFSPKQDSLNDFMVEESALHELEMVTAQFTAKKRICFRDALYRLAENSKPPPHSSQEDDIIPMLTSDEENLRYGETEVEELIAGLMFCRMNFAEDENNKKLKLSNCGLSQHKVSYCPLLARFAEVPIIPT